jgi:hypothetical protein
MRRSAFWRVSVKLISETCPLLYNKGDACFYYVSSIMQVKETRISRGASPFIRKEDAFPIPYIER